MTDQSRAAVRGRSKRPKANQPCPVCGVAAYVEHKPDCPFYPYPPGK